MGAAALASLPRWARAAMEAGAAEAPAPTPSPMAPPFGPDLIVRNDRPEHLETTLEALGRSWITRNDRFFVRSHLSVPSIEVADWRLAVTGMVASPLSLTLGDLKALPQ